MLSYEDCIGMCELTPEEIEAVAEHEHVPEIVAAELGNYLLNCEDGVLRIRRILLDDIHAAEAADDRARCLHLKLVLKHFMDNHPDRRAD